MNKFLIILLTSGVLFASNYEISSEYKTASSEKARIQGYKSILVSFNDKDKKISDIIDKEKYLLAFDNYLSENTTNNELKRYLQIYKQEQIQKISSLLNKDFSYEEKSVNYIKYLKSIIKKLPDTKRMELVRDIVLEIGEVNTFMTVIKEVFPQEIINDKSTFQKNRYFEKIQNKALKYYILRTMYVTKDFSSKDLEKLLSFVQSNEFKRIKNFRRDYIIDIFKNKDNFYEKTEETRKQESDLEDEFVEKIEKDTNLNKKVEIKSAEEEMKEIVAKTTKDGKKKLMSKKEIQEFKMKKKELDYSKKIKAAQKEAEEKGIDPLMFDPLSVDDEKTK